MRSIRSEQHSVVADHQQRPSKSSSASWSRRRASTSRLLVGSSSSSTSGRRSSCAASPTETTSPPLSEAESAVQRDVAEAEPVELGAQSAPRRPSRRRWRRTPPRRRHRQPSASSAAMTGATPSTSATVRSRVERQRLRQIAERCRRRSPTPAVGRNSPAISRSSVLLPAPLGATRPVRPPGTVKDRSVEQRGVVGPGEGQIGNRRWKTCERSRERVDGTEGTIRRSSGHPEMSSPSMSGQLMSIAIAAHASDVTQPNISAASRWPR